MKTSLLTFYFTILLSVCVSAQTKINFQKDGNEVIVNVTKTLTHGIYTYNQYVDTDTSILITTEEENFDLLIRDVKTKQNLLINIIPNEKHSFIRCMDSYSIEVGEPAHFFINTKEDCVLKSNLPITSDFIATETGVLEKVSNQVLYKNFVLYKDRVYGFKYIASSPETTTLSLSLQQGGKIIESRDISVKSKKCNIKIIADVIILDAGFQKEISYKIQSSSPVLSDIELSLELKVEINGFTDHLTIDNLLLKEKQTTLTDKIIKQFQGRSPRSFRILSTKVIIKQHDNDANYYTNISNNL